MFNIRSLKCHTSAPAHPLGHRVERRPPHPTLFLSADSPATADGCTAALIYNPQARPSEPVYMPTIKTSGLSHAIM